MVYKFSKEDIDKMDDDVKPFMKEEMTYQEIAMIGQYRIRKRVDRIKAKIRGVFKREKNRKDNS